VVAHRGWPTRFPDNTLAGAMAAIEVSDAVETDIRRSADGKLVLSHDPLLGGFEVASTSWAVLAELDLGGGHHPALLDEMIAAIPNTPIQFEIKNMPHQPGFEPDHRLALETAERVRAGDVITSFNPATVDRVRQDFPEVATGLCVSAFADIGGAIEHCLETGHRALVPSVDIPVLDMIAAVESRLLIYPWVVNHADRAQELAAIGVAGIITDDPGKIYAGFGGE
jgi:glycerophosphoryl diester phosphodiesterase